MTLIGRRSLRAAFAGALLATGFVLGSATAHAAAADPRATPHDGNATTCDAAGLAGSILEAPADYTYARGKVPDDQYVDILTVSPAVTVTGIVVKGGDGYNVYEPGKLGLPATPPWTDLRSPNVGQNDNIPQLSHWYVCGTGTTTTKTTTTKTATSTSETTATTTTTASSTTTSSGTGTTTPESSAGDVSSSAAGAAVVTTTTSGPKTSAQNASELAYTGFNGGWLIGLGVALVLGGAALMFLVRARRKA